MRVAQLRPAAVRVFGIAEGAELDAEALGRARRVVGADIDLVLALRRRRGGIGSARRDGDHLLDRRFQLRFGRGLFGQCCLHDGLVRHGFHGRRFHEHCPALGGRFEQVFLALGDLDRRRRAHRLGVGLDRLGALDDPQLERVVGLPLVDGLAQPGNRQIVIALDAAAGAIGVAQVDLGVDVAALGGDPVPFGRPGEIPGHAFAAFVHVAHVVLRARVALARRLLVPVDGPGVIPWHADAGVIRDAKVVLALGEAGFGGPAVPRGGGRVILGNARALGIHQPQRELGLRLALVGEGTEFPERGGVVAGPVCLGGGNNVGPRRWRKHDEKRDRKE